MIASRCSRVVKNGQQHLWNAGWRPQFIKRLRPTVGIRCRAEVGQPPENKRQEEGEHWCENDDRQELQFQGRRIADERLEKERVQQYREDRDAQRNENGRPKRAPIQQPPRPFPKTAHAGASRILRPFLSESSAESDCSSVADPHFARIALIGDFGWPSTLRSSVGIRARQFAHFFAAIGLDRGHLQIFVRLGAHARPTSWFLAGLELPR